MDQKQQSELIFRNAQLEHQIDELKAKISKLEEQCRHADSEIDRLENLLSLVPKESLPSGIKLDIGSRQLRFMMCTVMYVDIRGYKSMANETRSSFAIDELDQIIIHFDEICERLNLQIIKTIGDSYMCAGGIPNKNITNPIDVVLGALDMIRYLKDLKSQYEKLGQKFWEIKIGIHTGPVVAIPIGKKKISYDIKGETVNIATRMASAADPFKINVSILTYELIRDYFVTDYNGVTPVKYQGDIEMYYIRRIRPALSQNRQLGDQPNETFHIKYALRQFTDLQEFILDKLEKELPKSLHYHNFKHTIDVVNQAELIGLGEGVGDEDILLLKTAALFHDSGYIIGYENHEFLGTKIARSILPKWRYTPELIDKICDLIMATKLPPNPKTLLEKVMCDADLDYLGRADFIPVSNALYQELIEQGRDIDMKTWNINQVTFLTNHQYFTNTALRLREVGKEFQIERLRKLNAEEEVKE